MARRPFIIVVAVVLCVAGGVALYLQFGSSSPAPLARQNANTHLSTADSSISASPAGSSLGAPRERVATISASNPATILINTQECRDIPMKLENYRREANCGPTSRTDSESQARYAACLNNVTTIRETIRMLEHQQQGCGGYDPTPAGLFAATKAAAEQGDERARLCFIWGMFADRRDTVGLPQADVDAYPALASKYIEKGLANGDWRTVFILSEPVRFGSLLGKTNYGVGTPETEYKMTKLLQLGANKDFSAKLEESLANFVRGNASMTADVVAAWDQWAQDMYAAHFAGSERLDDMPADGCPLPSGATS